MADQADDESGKPTADLEKPIMESKPEKPVEGQALMNEEKKEVPAGEQSPVLDSDWVENILAQIEDQNVCLDLIEELEKNYEVLEKTGNVKKFFLVSQKGCNMVDMRVPTICLSIGEKLFERLDLNRKMEILSSVYQRRKELGIPLKNFAEFYPSFRTELTAVLNNGISGEPGSEEGAKKILGKLAWSFLISPKTALWHSILLALSDKNAPPLIAQVFRFFPALQELQDPETDLPLVLIALYRIFRKEIRNCDEEDKEANFSSLVIGLSRRSKAIKGSVVDPTLVVEEFLLVALLSETVYRARLCLFELILKIIKSSNHYLAIDSSPQQGDKKETVLFLPLMLASLAHLWSQAKEGRRPEEASIAAKSHYLLLALESKKGNKGARMDAKTLRWLLSRFNRCRWEMKLLISYNLLMMGLELPGVEVIQLEVPQCLFDGMPLLVKLKEKGRCRPFECPSDPKAGAHNPDRCRLQCMLELVRVAEVNMVSNILFGKDAKDMSGGFIGWNMFVAALQRELPFAQREHARRLLELAEMVQPVNTEPCRTFLPKGSQAAMEAESRTNSCRVLTDAAACLMLRMSKIDSPHGQGYLKKLGKGIVGRMTDNVCVLLKEKVESLCQTEWEILSKGRDAGSAEQKWEKREVSSGRLRSILLAVFEMGVNLSRTYSAYLSAIEGSGSGEIFTPESVRALLATLAQKNQELGVESRSSMAGMFSPASQAQKCDSPKTSTETMELLMKNSVDDKTVVAVRNYYLS